MNNDLLKRIRDSRNNCFELDCSMDKNRLKQNLKDWEKHLIREARKVGTKEFTLIAIIPRSQHQLTNNRRAKQGRKDNSR